MANQKSGDARSFNAFKQQLKAGQIDQLYVLHGEEDYLRTHYLGQLRQMLVGGFAEAFNYHLFEGKELELQKLAEAVESVPMMSERTLVEVRDFEMFKAREEVRDGLVELLSDLPPYVCLVFVYDQVEYHPDGRMKKLAGAMKKATVVEFPHQNERELVSWIQRRFKAADKQIDAELCRYLISRTGGTMSTMIPEIEKVVAFSQSEWVSRAEIDAVVTPTLEASVFDMTNLIAAGSFPAAAEKLQELFQMQNEPIPVLGALGWQLRRLYAARVYMEAGRGSDAVREALNMSDAAAQKLCHSARRFSTAWCANAVRLCCLSDYRLKSSYGDGEQLIFDLLMRLAREAQDG